MQFALIDQIVDLQPGVSITATKSLTLAEEYLQDHFPRFPVMPGVLMLECMYQAASWLVYEADQFRYSTILLREARNVKFAEFVQPGQTLTVRATVLKREGSLTTLKGLGTLGETTAVSGKIVLERINIADEYPERAAWEEYSRREMRRRFLSLYAPQQSS